MHQADTPDIFFTRTCGAGSVEFRVTPQGTELALAALRDSPVGWAAWYLGMLSGFVGLNALWMQGTRRRNWLLVVPLRGLFAQFVGAGLGMTLA